MSEPGSRNWFRDWVVPIFAATLTALTLYGWAFEAQFNKEVEKKTPEMRRQVQEMLDKQGAEIERDRLIMLNRIDARLTRIEALLEQHMGEN